MPARGAGLPGKVGRSCLQDRRRAWRAGPRSTRSHRSAVACGLTHQEDPLEHGEVVRRWSSLPRPPLKPRTCPFFLLFGGHGTITRSIAAHGRHAVSGDASLRPAGRASRRVSLPVRQQERLPRAAAAGRHAVPVEVQALKTHLHLLVLTLNTHIASHPTADALRSPPPRHQVSWTLTACEYGV